MTLQNAVWGLAQICSEMFETRAVLVELLYLMPLLMNFPKPIVKLVSSVRTFGSSTALAHISWAQSNSVFSSVCKAWLQYLSAKVKYIIKKFIYCIFIFIFLPQLALASGNIANNWFKIVHNSKRYCRFFLFTPLKKVIFLPVLFLDGFKCWFRAAA